MDYYNAITTRPRRTRKDRISLIVERTALDLPPHGSVQFVDVHTAMRVLERDQKWRSNCLELFFALIVMVALLYYVFGPRWIDDRFFVVDSVKSDIGHRVFGFKSYSFDMNTPLDVNQSFQPWTTVNIDPYDVKMPNVPPAPIQFDTCGPDGIPTTSTVNTAPCLPVVEPKTYFAARSIPIFQAWMRNSLNKSRIWYPGGKSTCGTTSQTSNSNPDNAGGSFLLLGGVQVRLLRGKSCGKANEPFCYLVAKSTGNEDQTPIPQCGLIPSTFPGFGFSTSTQLTQFPDPFNPTRTLNGSAVRPQLSYRLSYYYPNDGFAFTFPKTNRNEAIELWDELVKCQWINPNSTSLVSTSFTVFDPISNSFVFTRFAFQMFTQGSRFPTMDIRHFRVPGSVSDEAQPARIALCIVSLAEIIFFLARALYRGYKVRNSNSYGWLLLDVISLVIIQTAVWLSIGLSLDPTVQAMSSPQALTQLASCTYQSYVSEFDYISYIQKLEDFLLGIAIVLQGLKFFQLCRMSSRLSAAYSIARVVLYDLFTWFVLTSCFFFFFVFGAYFFFGMILAEFSTLPQSMTTLFLLISRVPEYFGTGEEDNVLFADAFWKTLEYTSLKPTLWEQSELSNRYSSTPLFAFSTWIGFVIVIMIWLLRNVLLGIVISGSEHVKRDIESEENERRERAEVYAEAKKRRNGLRKSSSELFVQYVRTGVSRALHHDNFRKLITILRTDPVLARQGFATYEYMNRCFQESQLPEEFRRDILSSFGFVLDSVDDALLILRDQENPFHFSFASLVQIAKAETEEEAVKRTLEAVTTEWIRYKTLPFVRLVKVDLEKATQLVVDVRRQLGLTIGQGHHHTKSAAKEEQQQHLQHQRVLRNSSDPQAVPRRLALRVSSEVEQAVFRELQDASTAPRILIQACQEELKLDFSSCANIESILCEFVYHDLLQAYEMESRFFTQPAVEALGEIFPSTLMGFSNGTTADISPEATAEMMNTVKLRVQDLRQARRQKFNMGGLHEEFDDRMEKSSSARSLSGHDDEDEAMKRAILEDEEFDPEGQMKWEKAVKSGDLLLSLIVVHSLRFGHASDALKHDLVKLERSQKEMESFLISAQKSINEKILGRKPLAVVLRESRKHGIEYHPNLKKYYVHFVSPKTGEYKLVGVFNSQEEAMQAMMTTIMEDSRPKRSKRKVEKAFPQHGGGGGEENDFDDFDDDFSSKQEDLYQDDDVDYQALHMKNLRKKQDEKRAMLRGDLTAPESNDDDDDSRESFGSDGGSGVGGGRPARTHSEHSLSGASTSAGGNVAQESGGGALNTTTASPDMDDDDPVQARKYVESIAQGFNRFVSVCASGFSKVVSAFTSKTENLIYFDGANGYWRDNQGNRVEVSVNPKTVEPLAGLRYTQMLDAKKKPGL